MPWIISLIFSVFTLFLIQSEATDNPKLIIDADTANEVDDLFALARAIKEPGIDLLAISSAQFHTSPLTGDSSVWESQKINEELVEILSADADLPLGASSPLKDSQSPNVSEASNYIVEQARGISGEEKLNVIILGSCTNVASAILQAPDIVQKLRVYYLGFWHDPITNTYDKKEFNSGNDTLAVDVLLDEKDLEFIVMSATTSQHLTLEKEALDSRLGGTEIGDYLIQRWETYDRWWTEEDSEKKSWIMWDLAIVEAFINPTWAILHQFKTPPENTQREIGVFTEINTELMEEKFWSVLEEQ